MRTDKSKGLDVMANTANLIWVALSDVAGKIRIGNEWVASSEISGQVSTWDEWLGPEYAGKSLQDMYLELLVRCAKIISLGKGPAFQCRPRSRRFSLHTYVDVLPAGEMLGKIAQSIFTYQNKLSVPLIMAHPLVKLLMEMLDEKISSEDLAKLGQDPAVLSDLSLIDLCLFLFSAFRAVGPYASFGASAHFIENYRDDERVKYINCAVDAFRENVRRQQGQIKLWERSTVRRRQKVSSDIAPLLENNKRRLYVVRIDLWLNPDGQSMSKANPQALFQTFLNKLRFKPSIFKRLQGLIWRVQQFPKLPQAYHCLFILDGTLIGNGAEFADLIGKYWQTNITAGRGLWFDWAQHKSSLCQATTGVIDPSDNNKRKHILTGVLPYFTDFDLYVRHPVNSEHNGPPDRGNTALRLFGYRHFQH